MSLVTLAAVWALSAGQPMAVARFTFQSPQPLPTPLAPPPEEIVAPEPVTVPVTQELPTAPALLPLAPAPGQTAPQDDFAPVFRILATALGYVWLGCGILVLLAIPLGLVWLNQRARHLAPPAVVDDQENATE